MKANEFRIGNIINEDEEIISISFDSVEVSYDSISKGNATRWKDLTEIAPIPLTEEWLVKFGFTKKVDYEQSQDEWGILAKRNSRRGLGLYQPEDYKKDNYWFVTFREDVGCGWSDLNEVEYVHSLQNLYFALTGEELTQKPHHS